MVRPAWMENGNISEAGVPEKLAYGRFGTTKSDRMRHLLKMDRRKQRQKQIQQQKLRFPRKPFLTKEQRTAGARLII